MSSLVPLLILLPFLVGACLLTIRTAPLRNALVVGAGITVMALSGWTALALGGRSDTFFGLPMELPTEQITTFADVGIAAVVIGFGLFYRRLVAPLLALAQLTITLVLLWSGRSSPVEADRLFRFDRLTAVMVLVIGLVGPLICVQALGYMRDYHRANPMARGRRPVFFALLFAFLGAMFGLVVANSLPVLLVFWELTTLCSFLLIGYTRTAQTIGYAFRALNMNMFGGLAFSIAIAVLAGRSDGWDLARVTAVPASGAAVSATAALAVAAMTKSAQMPFSDWLLGAMYAPTPTSALLHSSTMVKAGVFLLLRLAPATAGSVTGTLIALTGMTTFLFASVMAVTERNAKKILAYSTISYLGLITGCAGIGSPQAVWVGVMIIVFHALAKGLLFLVVGTVENRLYTKDVEHFDSLLSRLPRVSVLALTGIAGMFIAPFGIVVAKWAAIQAFLAVPGWQGATYIVTVAFASSFTIFYWGKLLIKVLAMRAVRLPERAIERRVSTFEWVAESALAVGVIVVAAFLGPLSDHVVVPYVMSSGLPGAAPDQLSPGVVAVMLLALLFLPALAVWGQRRGSYDEADFYASGRRGNVDHAMGSALGGTRAVTLGGYYLEGLIDGRWVSRAGTTLCGLTVALLAVCGWAVQ
jgi:ech hydrogenase subunit A